MFGNLFRGEKHIVDGRKIYIKGLRKYPPEFAAKIRDAILTFCQVEEIAARFPKLYFAFKRGNKATIGSQTIRSAAWVYMDNNADGATPTVFLNSDLSITLLRDMNRILVHELTHAWQATTSEKVARILQKIARLRKRSSTLPFIRLHNPEREALAAVKALRMELAKFLFGIHVEGLARFAEEERTGRLTYSLAHARADAGRYSPLTRDVANGWMRLLVQIERKEPDVIQRGIETFNNRLWIDSYKIGLHMVQTILLAERATIDALLRMSDLAFVKAYENACRDLGITPVVSLTGTAPVCYNRMIKELATAVQRRESKNS